MRIKNTDYRFMPGYVVYKPAEGVKPELAIKDTFEIIEKEKLPVELHLDEIVLKVTKSSTYDSVLAEYHQQFKLVTADPKNHEALLKSQDLVHVPVKTADGKQWGVEYKVNGMTKSETFPTLEEAWSFYYSKLKEIKIQIYNDIRLIQK